MTAPLTRAELVQRRDTWSERIGHLRKRLKLSPRQFADLLGVNLRTVYRWELGQSAPMGSSITILAVLEQHATIATAHRLVHDGGLSELIVRALRKRGESGQRKKRSNGRRTRELWQVGEPDQG